MCQHVDYFAFRKRIQFSIDFTLKLRNILVKSTPFFDVPINKAFLTYIQSAVLMHYFRNN